VSYQLLTTAEDEDTYFRQSVEITPEAIQEEFIRIPADMAYWGAKYAEASRTYLIAEQAVKEVRARLRLAIRETASAKLTVDAVDAQVEGQAEYQSAKMAEIEAEAAKLLAKVKLDAVIAKRDMAMSLGAHLRAEMGSSHIRDR
jgi:hypothetical protein